MSPRAVYQQILAYNADRDPERLARKLALMRGGPFPFFRGTAHLFYGYSGLLAPLAGSPAVWSSGDLHVENFGCYKGDNRLTYFDLNDFDEAALGPVSWDLVRLLTSLTLGLMALDVSPREIATRSRQFLQDYGRALASGKPRWLERATARGPIRRLMQRAKLRTRRALLGERVRWNAGHTRRRLRLIDGHTLPASRIEHRRIGAAIRRLHVPGIARGFFQPHDIARRVAGTASLGLPRYTVLIEGRGSPTNNYLLDVKAATPSALAGASPYRQPSWVSEGERVTTVQQWMQAVSPALLAAMRQGQHAFVVRELQPTEDRFRFAPRDTHRGPMESLLRSLAEVVAWGHLRPAGRAGAASFDTLMSHGRARGWHQAVLRAARQAAQRVQADWEAFAERYDRSAS